VRCRNKTCGKQKSLKRLRKEIAIIVGFYQQQPAYRVASDLGLDYQVVSRIYQRLREAIYHVAELEAGKLKGEIEIDDAYFDGRREGKRGRGAAGKALFWAFWSVMGGCIPRSWSGLRPMS
jgi:transposase